MQLNDIHFELAAWRGERPEALWSVIALSEPSMTLGYVREGLTGLLPRPNRW
jgi:hypothetical protein